MKAKVVLNELPFPQDVFLQKAKELSNKVFLIQTTTQNHLRKITWAEAADEALRMASALLSMNLAPRSHIAILSKNCAHWILADLAIWLAGHVSVPLYPNLTTETAKVIFEHSDVKAVFIGKLDKAATMIAAIPDNVSRISFPDVNDEQSLKWNDLVEAHQPISESDIQDSKPNLKDIATIVYTSGTTGKPKGVMHSYEAFSFAALNGVNHLNLGSHDRMFSYLPLAHVAERLLVEGFALYSGASVYFAGSLDQFSQNIKDAKPTVFLAVPRIWLKLQQGILSKFSQAKLNFLLSLPLVSFFVKSKVQKSLGLDHVTLPVTGAAPVSRELLEWFAKLGIEIQEAYGMTENLAYSHAQLAKKIKLGSVGQPMLGVDVKINPQGEVLVKSLSNMLGYYKDPEQTAAAFEEGFLKTGDMGKVDDKGYLSLTGRVKDLFKTGKGKYVAPNPIEMKLSNSPYVSQVCVVGQGLSQPLAIAILTPGISQKNKAEVKGDLERFLKELNSTLDPHERLSKIVFVDDSWSVENEFLTPTLKIKRNRIEQKYESSFESWENQRDRIIM
jgi:long-subunit acyl-CoA synthetase (AMP-forming)